MNLWDWSSESPVLNLACDEALLDQSEEQGGAGWLRFWQSPVYFVVVGYSNRVEAEVEVQSCHDDGIPILRRCTGGGTVLQGPGCLNYSLVLPISKHSDFESISSTNCHILRRNGEALSRLLGRPVHSAGQTDLALNDKKFCGNAQRRKRTHLLFHGSLLVDFNLDLIGRYLRHPSKEPDYRRHRSHADFLVNLHLSAESLKQAMAEAWGARPGPSPDLQGRAETLLTEKYSNPVWIYR